MTGVNIQLGDGGDGVVIARTPLKSSEREMFDNPIIKGCKDLKGIDLSCVSKAVNKIKKVPMGNLLSCSSERGWSRNGTEGMVLTTNNISPPDFQSRAGKS